MSDSASGRIKVLFVMPNFAGGGAERVALRLLSQVDRAAFVPQLAVLDGRGPLRPLVSDEVVVHEFGQRRLRQAIPALLRLIRRERPAVVFASQGYLNIALLALRTFLPAATKLALRESSTPSLSLPHQRHPRLMRWAYRHFYRRVDLMLCQHRGTEREMAADFGVPEDRIVGLANPVPVAELRLSAAAPQREAGPGLRFVAAGRLSPEKGFDRLVAAFPRLPADAQLTIYGEGPGRGALETAIRSAGLQGRVSLAGFSDVLPAALAGADACVISSHWEGLPNVALEALAVGTPVVATLEAGGLAEVAEAAPPGAVTLLPWGDAFLDRLAGLPASTVAAPRPSLLPPHYALEEVAALFNRQLLRLAGSAEVGYQVQP